MKEVWRQEFQEGKYSSLDEGGGHVEGEIEDLMLFRRCHP